MSFLSDGVAVVTVTRLRQSDGRWAQQLAGAGSALALADIDEAGLLENGAIVGEEERSGYHAHALDVADEAGVRSFAEDVARRHGRVTLLINNAGVSLHGDFAEISPG